MASSILAPRVSNGVRFQTLPTSNDASFTLLSDWTEVNPGTPQFSYDLNNTGVTAWSDGAAGNSSSITYDGSSAPGDVPLAGDDYFDHIPYFTSTRAAKRPAMLEEVRHVMEAMNWK